ncbi:BNR-4 repeat-containing protein [Maribacter sp. R77961]|uniref:BNR-4 repeat-containing protein n=1 Tax=Maribacter sp. R77961 TaxID=3093871 RepID=UPI0037C75DFF
MMSKEKAMLLLFISVLLFACNSSKKNVPTTENNVPEVDFFADNGFGNAVAVVQHPAGIYHEGITYVCYQGPKEDPYVASYNHRTKEWKGPFRAGISEMGKDPNRKKRIDNHGKPSMLIDDAGYIHITFGGHGGMKKHGENTLGNHHYGKNLHAVSKKPLDITSWETLDNISPFGTYNQMIKMDNGDIYLFYRHGAHRSNWVYQKSTDNGRTFGEPISFLKHKRRTEIEAEDSWYPWLGRGQGDDIIVAFDYHICRDNKNAQDKRGHIPERHHVYYMVFDTKLGKWKNVKNEPLQIPLTKEMADEKALVANTGTDWTFQGVTEVDANGNPHIGITVGPDIGEKRSGPKRMRYLKWDDTEWVSVQNSGLPIGNGDIELTSKNEVQFYIAAQNSKGTGEVARWDGGVNGETFQKTKILLTKPNANFAISTVIENPHPDARLIVAERKRGTDYRKMYLLGDNGPVMRLKNEALVLKEK